MRFADVTGHDDLKRAFIASVQGEHVAHAQLLHGPPGGGVLPFALACATYLQCTDRGPDDACGQCDACRKSRGLVHPDTHFTYPTESTKARLSTERITDWREALRDDPYQRPEDWLARLGKPDSKGKIYVEECRRIISTLGLKRSEGRHKVWIVWQVEQAGVQSNILLKVLEEPPPDTVFLVVTHRRDDVLPTILSRTQQTLVPPIAPADLEAWLMDAHGLDRERARHTAFLAEGDRTAAALLAEGRSNDHRDLLMTWWPVILKMRTGGDASTAETLTGFIDAVAGLGRTPRKILLRYALFFVRETLAIHAGQPHRLDETEAVMARTLLDHLDPRQLIAMSGELNTLHYGIERNGNARILFMNASLRLARIARTAPFDQTTAPTAAAR